MLHLELFVLPLGKKYKNGEEIRKNGNYRECG
jgi:hypothetical protein